MEVHDRPRPLPFPAVVAPRASVDEADLAEVEAAVAMVRAGGAARIRLVGLHDAARIAGVAAARAQAAGLAFRLDPRDPQGGVVSLPIGPRT